MYRWNFFRKLFIFRNHRSLTKGKVKHCTVFLGFIAKRKNDFWLSWLSLFTPVNNDNHEPLWLQQKKYHTPVSCDNCLVKHEPLGLWYPPSDYYTYKLPLLPNSVLDLNMSPYFTNKKKVHAKTFNNRIYIQCM